jgi:hypothetical protein
MPAEYQNYYPGLDEKTEKFVTRPIEPAQDFYRLTVFILYRYRSFLVDEGISLARDTTKHEKIFFPLSLSGFSQTSSRALSRAKVQPEGLTRQSTT